MQCRGNASCCARLVWNTLSIDRRMLFVMLLLLCLGSNSYAFSVRRLSTARVLTSCNKKNVQCCSASSIGKRDDLSYFSLSMQNGNDSAIQEEVTAATEGTNLTQKEQTLGILVLLTVPLAWGTYVPVVRYLYEIQPPVPGFVFSACYYLVASLTTISMLAIQRQNQSPKTISATDQAMDAKKISLSTENNPTSSLLGNTSGKSSFPILGGIELGTYLFLGNCLQVIGLKSVPSARAGFLVQLTTVMVPLVEAIIAGDLKAVPTRTWFSCLLAILGIFVMSFDGLASGSVTALAESFTSDDLLIVAAAFSYTMHVVRLGGYAKDTTPLELAASKATVETILSVGLVVASMTYAATISATASIDGNVLSSFLQQTGEEISSFFVSIIDGIQSGNVPTSALYSALFATLWTGWVTCAYTIWSQAFGQQRVTPTNANLIYSLQPIFTASFAYLLLGETMESNGIFGGALIGLAVYLVAAGTTMNDNSDSNSDLGPPQPNTITKSDKNYQVSEKQTTAQKGEKVLVGESIN